MRWAKACMSCGPPVSLSMWQICIQLQHMGCVDRLGMGGSPYVMWTADVSVYVVTMHTNTIYVASSMFFGELSLELALSDW